MSLFYSQAINAALISFEHFHFKTTNRQHFTNFRDFPRFINYEPGDGSEVVSFDLHVEESFDLADLSRTEYFVTTFFYACNDLFKFLAGNVFVFDLPDDLFEDIFDRHETAHAAILVDHHREL